MYLLEYFSTFRDCYPFVFIPLTEPINEFFTTLKFNMKFLFPDFFNISYIELGIFHNQEAITESFEIS